MHWYVPPAATMHAAVIGGDHEETTHFLFHTPISSVRIFVLKKKIIVTAAVKYK